MVSSECDERVLGFRMQRVCSWVQDAKSEFLDLNAPSTHMVSSECDESILGFKMQRVSSWVQDAKSEFMGSGCKE